MNAHARKIHEENLAILTDGLLLENSIGVDIIGTIQKACSFNCPYCSLGPSTKKMNQIKSEHLWPSIESIALATEDQLQNAVALNSLPDYIEISGNGEPTLHPQIPEIIDIIIQLKNQYSPQTKVCLLTNGAHIDSKKLIPALNLCDQLIVKLDAGSDDIFAVANKPLVRMNVSRVISSCKLYSNISIQAMFFKGETTNTEDDEISEWIEVTGMIQPAHVYLTTLDSTSKTDSILPVSEDTLYTILSKLKRRTAIEAEVLLKKS